MSRLPIRILQVLLPIVLLGGAGLTAYLLYLNRPPVGTQAPTFEPPGVRVQPVTFETRQLTVTSQGTVQPRTSSQLVSEISGPVTEVAPSFAVGGFFEAGDVLLRIDPYDYQQAVIAGRSQLARARLRLAQEEAEAEVARREWEELGRGDPSALTLRQPQVEDARATVAAAEAAVDRATRDIERAEIRAPYAGRVQSKDVDIGQVVNTGNPLARIYAVDAAEIRLPLPDAELAYVDVPLSYRGGEQRPGPRVTLSADFAGRRHTWQGRIVRTDGEIDPMSRMVHVIAEVRDPYAPSSDPSRPPLAVGMFVEAELEGRTVRDVVVLPRGALRGRDQVLVVDESSRLRFRQVDLLRSTGNELLVQGGLAEGEMVCVSALDTVTDGMAVRVLDDDVRMARTATDDAPTVPEPDSSASAPDTDPPSGATTPPAADFDIDPTLSRDQQIAAIRRQLELLSGSPAAPSTQTAGAAPDRAAEPAARGADGRPGPAAAGPDRPPGARGRGGAGAPGGRGGRAGRGGPAGRCGRGDSAPPAAPSATPRAEPDTAPAPAEPTAEPGARPAGLADALRSVAVLPFVNVSRNPADDWIGGDMTAALQTALEETGAMGIVALTAADESTALETAEARNARWLVTGGYQRIGDQLRITARVLDVAGGDLMRSVKMDGTLGELEALTSELIAAVRTGLDGDSDTRRVAADRDPTERTDPGGRTGVAVLPFANISRNPADDRIAGDVAEALAIGLRELDGVTVVPLEAGDEATALDAAGARNARWLVSGGYQHVAGQLRVTARLLDVATGGFVQTIKVDGLLAALPDLLAEVVSTLRTVLGLETRSAARALGRTSSAVVAE